MVKGPLEALKNLKQTNCALPRGLSARLHFLAVSTAGVLMREIPVCLDTLPVDIRTLSRMLCCGKVTHLSCHKDIKKSSMNHIQKNSCPLCRTEYPETDKEELKRLRKWVAKGAAWAQTNLASHYRFGTLGLTQSYDKAIQLRKMAIMAIAQGHPHGCVMYDRGEVLINWTKVLLNFTQWQPIWDTPVRSTI